MKLFVKQSKSSSKKLGSLDFLTPLSMDEMYDWSGGYGSRSNSPAAAGHAAGNAHRGGPGAAAAASAAARAQQAKNVRNGLNPNGTKRSYNRTGPSNPSGGGGGGGGTYGTPSSQGMYTITFYVNLPGDAQETSSVALDGGHVFMGLEDNSKDTESVMGFYPQTGDGVLVKTLPGEMKNDKDTHYDTSYEFNITKDQYTNAMKYIGELSTNNYNLYTNNCTDIANKVGNFVGIKIPGSGLKGGDLLSNPNNFNEYMKNNY